LRNSASTVPCFSNFHSQLEIVNDQFFLILLIAKKGTRFHEKQPHFEGIEVHCKIQGPKISTVRYPDPVMPKRDKNGLMAGSAEML
jgi:hypothetical protein